jgi:hypothetical protein
MPKRPGHIPTDRELDSLAEITDDDVDDAVETMKRGVPASAPLLDATQNDKAGGASGPIADEQ